MSYLYESDLLTINLNKTTQKFNNTEDRYVQNRYAKTTMRRVMWAVKDGEKSDVGSEGW